MLYQIYAPYMTAFRLNPLIGPDITFHLSDANALKLLDDCVIAFLAKEKDLVNKTV
jgi:hypothetical protein